MRILFFSNAYKPTVSGVVTSVALFRQGLTKAGHDVHVIAPEYQGFEDDEPYVFRFPAIDLTEQVDVSLAMPFKAPMMRTVRGLKPDVIHSQHPIWMGDVAADLAHELGVPLVFTFHCRYDDYARELVPVASDLVGMVAEQIVRRYLAKCSHVVAPTRRIGEMLLREYEAKMPVTIVPTPVDLSQYQDLDPQPVRNSLGLQDARLLLYMGRLSPEKNLDFLLRAFARVVAADRLTTLLLLGKGQHESHLRRLSQQMGISERVIFAGPVPHHEIPRYAAAADVFVFSSLIDVQPLVLIEAMAAGTPVIAVEATGSADVLAKGGGLLVSPREDVFAHAVLELLNDEPRSLALGKEAAQAAQNYAIPSASARLVAVYEEAIVASHGTGQ